MPSAAASLAGSSRIRRGGEGNAGALGALARACAVALLPIFFWACQTADPELASRTAAINAAIAQEPPGNYFVGRRFFKEDYKMWGWVRQPRAPWNTAQLVMLNEQRKLAPDRAGGKLGTDNNFEYRLQGYFSGETVYEPASNRFYPEFILLDYQLLDTTPPLIFKDRRSIDPKVRLLAPPI